MAKPKRGKRKNKRNRRRQSFDKPRTCVSSPEVANKSQTIFNLVDLIAPILTPSPVLFHDCDVQQQQQTDVSLSKLFQSPIILKTPSLKDDADLLAISATPKRNKNDSSGSGVRCSILNYRTPIKRTLRTSRNFARSLTPKQQQSNVFLTDCDKHKSPKHDIYTTFDDEKVRFYSPMISPMHNSTPKDVKSETPTLLPHPILKVEEKKVEVDISPILTPEYHRINKFRKIGYRKLPVSLLHVYSWLQAALKKGYAALKRLICGERFCQNVTVPETSELFQKCLRENQQLNRRINELQTELKCFKTEMEHFEVFKTEMEHFEVFKKEFKMFKEQFNAAHVGGVSKPPFIPPPAPPPPPPLPPPPFQLVIGPTPTSRPTKTMNRKNNENSRPLITVEEILKVRLKKANVSTSFSRKNPLTPSLKNDEILKQVKLRPMRKVLVPPSARPQVLGTSPVSTLERMLRDVDSTNVRSVRRAKKTQFLSVNDVSRSPSFRYRHANDSAPVF